MNAGFDLAKRFVTSLMGVRDRSQPLLVESFLVRFGGYHT